MSSFKNTALACPIPILLPRRCHQSVDRGRRGQPIGLFDCTADYDDDAVQIKRPDRRPGEQCSDQRPIIFISRW